MATTKYEKHGAQLGKALAARRKELDLTQEDVARLGGPSRATQTAWEQGRVAQFSSRRTQATLAAYEKVFRWPAGHLTRLAQRLEEGGELNHVVTDHDWAKDTALMRGMEMQLRHHLLLVTEGVDGLEQLTLTLRQRRALERAQYHIGKLAMELSGLAQSTTTPESARDTD